MDVLQRISPRLFSPRSRRFKPIKTKEELKEHLQWAIGLELSTIPPYLSALYSIKATGSKAARLIRSVAYEEMLHMMQAANLLNAIGGTPAIIYRLPTYPTYMPHHVAGGPFIQLQRASIDLLVNTFMEIEQPQPPAVRMKALREGDEYETIGQFYHSIRTGFILLCREIGEAELFTGDAAKQQSSAYFGSGGGKLIPVRNLADALTGIHQIVVQGEGASGPYEPWGTDMPSDGPPPVGALDENREGLMLSHYFKFQKIATGAGDIPFPETWPMETNFQTAHLGAAWAQKLSDLFNACYVYVLWSLELALAAPARDGLFFLASFPMMHDVLPPLARLLLRTPLRPSNVVDASEVDPDASEALAPALATAGPSFEYVPSTLAEIRGACAELLDAPPSDAETAPGYAAALASTLAAIQGTLAKLPELPPPPRLTA